MLREVSLGPSPLTYNDAAMTAVRYRVLYGRSALTEYSDAADQTARLSVLIKLAAVAGSVTVKAAASASRQDPQAAERLAEIFNAVYAFDPRAPVIETHGAAAGHEFDELDVLALAVKLGAAHLVNDLPLFYLLSVCNRAAGTEDRGASAYKVDERGTAGLLGLV